MLTTRPLRCAPVLATIAATAIAGVSHAFQGPTGTHEEAIVSGAPLRFLRVVEEEGRRIELQVAATTFRPTEGEGPDVCLVGVAHIAESSMFRSIQRILDGFDVVLYESVKPEGAVRPGGDTDEERIQSTRASMRFVARLAELHLARATVYPEDLDELIDGVGEVDPRLEAWGRDASVDAWGGDLTYERAAEGDGFSLVSFGADGALGGDGPNADLRVSAGEHPAPIEMEAGDGLQAQLADALGLAFQLAEIDYDRPRWRCSDMSIDQVNRALKEEGVEFAELGGTLAGTSLSAKLIKALLMIVKFMDVATDGMVTDTVKVALIEVLGDESITEKALERQFGGGFAEVIIRQRNQVVLDDLQHLLADEPDVESVAIFYGAGHMPDLSRRLIDEFEYEASSSEWIPAISVNLATSAVSPRDIEQMRRMLRTMMRSF